MIFNRMSAIAREAVFEVAKAKFDLAILHIANAVLWALTFISQSSVIEILAGSLTGGILMGWAFAKMSGLVEPRALASRWAVNICFGVPIGIFMAYHYGGPEGAFPKVPGWAFAGLASGLSGALMVLALPIGVPLLGGLMKAVLERVLRKWLPEAIPQPTVTANIANTAPAAPAPPAVLSKPAGHDSAPTKRIE